MLSSLKEPPNWEGNDVTVVHSTLAISPSQVPTPALNVSYMPWIHCWDVGDALVLGYVLLLSAQPCIPYLIKLPS